MLKIQIKKIITIFLVSFLLASCYHKSENFWQDNYTKEQFRIEMQDGVKLHTSIYVPKDIDEPLPILLWRTPYGTAPYDEGFYTRMKEYLGEAKYIFVYQDVRGKFMSEGKFNNMRPYIPNKQKHQTDEASDTYDTIEWLINNVTNNNGKVGMWGISYPGFYASMSLMDSHPALKAVSPQAPISDWFIGDDMHHNGALSLAMTFNFFKVFGIEPNGLFKTWPTSEYFVSPDAYTFFNEIGPIKNIDEHLFQGTIPFWTDIMNHGTYDEFWQSRNILNHFEDVKPAVLVVGGWYDGENCYGALNTYKTIENKNPGINNNLIMGPWIHGGWVRTKGDSLGNVSFGMNNRDYYINKIELPFFNHHLKGAEKLNLAEATIFITGVNEWKYFEQWPPKNINTRKLFLSGNNNIVFGQDNIVSGVDEYISDPSKPVPYTSKVVDAKTFYPKSYMVEDQRFAACRPDVLVFKTEPLDEDLTVAGPLEVELYVSTSSTDADWVVKFIDVYPYDLSNPNPNPNEVEKGGFQQLLRGDIMRGKFRKNFENPEPFIPNKVTKVSFKMNDIMHTFKKGHMIMVQVQSSWFPLFDKNPQTFCDIYKADEEDFVKAKHKVYYSDKYPSSIKVGVMK